ncbi:RHS repeat domain-containing protein [Sphingomonas sp. RB1R13]|uniref:RHS repeat domain-containing protein n=1 Tax=Sphingomonas sp. RB1R13 TaxID=3096159 RepID=UPI002FCBBB58
MLSSLRCVMGLLFIIHAAVSQAQVAPLHVNESATDQFGIDRKTGRFVLDPIETISIGGKLGLSLSYYLNDSGLVIRQPSFNTSYDYNTLNSLVTIDGFEEPVTFTGNTTFNSEYVSGATLVKTASGYLYTNRQGVVVESTSNGVITIRYPDGRTTVYGYQYVANNLGFMIKSNSGSYAVNQTKDYCIVDSTTVCNNLGGNRIAAATSVSSGTFSLPDASGGITKIRGSLLPAKMWHQTSSFSPPDEWVYYPFGITYPGQVAESVSITNRSSGYETHDDIWVTSLQRDGVAVTYNVVKTLFGGGGALTPSSTYSLDIKALVSGSQVYESYAVKPSNGFGRSRRTLAWIQDGLARRTGYLYNASTEVSGVNLPDGRTVKTEYDARDNVVRSLSQAKAAAGPDLITSYAYAASCDAMTQATCNKPISITDPSGNVTDYTYNSMGQILTETKPASGGVRPKTTNVYAMRTAFTKGAGGVIVAAGAPISLIARSSLCKSQASCSGSSDEVVTIYDYGPATGLTNLSLMGVGVIATNGQGVMETRWTCYQYNYFGEIISKTQPNAGITVCP